MRKRRITHKIELNGDAARNFVAVSLVDHEGEKAKDGLAGPMLAAVEAELKRRKEVTAT